MAENLLRINEVPAFIWRNPLYFVAFGFGSGAVPWAPGTCGTLMAIPLYLLLCQFPWWLYALFLIIAIVFGFWLCEVTTKALGVHDHPGIVWDEFVGFWLTMFALPSTFGYVLFGFLLFRFFDIVKPGPIRWVNDHIRSGVGIVLDDLCAAIPAWLILQGFYLISHLI